MIHVRLLLLPILAALTIASSPLNYVLDASASSVSAKVAFFGLASKTAQFPNMAGSVRIAPEQPDKAFIAVTLDARKLTAPDEVTLKRLRGEKFFWVEKYPTIQFFGDRLTMIDARRAKVQGKLTARGVTREETLDVTFDTAPLTAPKGKAITLSGEMQIDRRDYGMTAYRLIVGRKVTIRMNARLVPGG
ncbi:YceI family protein [Altererythrobacter arenosus]|uniref:YceI family protein n=1 Tax=Altererythrobacter arenosus TaxID=3032592 RepID=A0ABY8G0P3_9SPHN|nr:YceI family protein [Altererythrobacter sp. CAU 1644]WFL77824.1 YceI family protein [Altererythrobacter sp. CAU 1644]